MSPRGKLYPRAWSEEATIQYLSTYARSRNRWRRSAMVGIPLTLCLDVADNDSRQPTDGAEVRLPGCRNQPSKFYSL